MKLYRILDQSKQPQARINSNIAGIVNTILEIHFERLDHGHAEFTSLDVWHKSTGFKPGAIGQRAPRQQVHDVLCRGVRAGWLACRPANADNIT